MSERKRSFVRKKELKLKSKQKPEIKLGKKMKPPHKELIADGNIKKPPRAKSVPSTASSEALTLLGDMDDEITTSASESYPNEESSSNEGNIYNIIFYQESITWQNLKHLSVFTEFMKSFFPSEYISVNVN